MKRILLGVALLVLAFSQQSFAAQATATMGDYNSSGVYRITCDINGVCTYAQDTGIIWPYKVLATNTTMTAAQSGTTLVSNASIDGITYTLPAATVGMQYTFIADTAKILKVYPATGEIINFASLSTSQGLSNSNTPAKGDHLILFCATAGQWSLKSMRNTWIAVS